MAQYISPLRRGVATVRDFESLKGPIAPNTNKLFLPKLVSDPQNKLVVDAFMNHQVLQDWAKNGVQENNKIGAARFFRFSIMVAHFFAHRYEPKAALMLLHDPYEKPDYLKTIARNKSIAESMQRNTVYMESWWKQVVLPSAKLADPSRTLEDINALVREPPKEDLLVVSEYIRQLTIYNSNVELWLDATLLSVGCVFGWSDRAVAYENDINTRKSGLFYETMILPYLKTEVAGQSTVVVKVDGKAQWNEDAEKVSAMVQDQIKLWTEKGQLTEATRFMAMLRRGYEMETNILDNLLSIK